VSIVYKGLDSYICVPLKADNRVVGVIELLNQTSETSFAFSKLDEQFLEAFGSLAAIAIEYVRDYRSNVDQRITIYGHITLDSTPLQVERGPIGEGVGE